jgi:hypothetical protein
MSIQKVPATDLQYYLVSYDNDGRERQDDPDGLMSARTEKAVREDDITDVFVMSHGWKGDVPAAIDQYDRWIGAMAECEADRKEIREQRPGFKPLLIGFHWPSQPWGEEEFGAGGGSFALAAGGTGGAAGIGPALDRFVDQYADRIADTPRAREAIRTVVTAAMNAGPGVTALPPEVAAAYSVLNEEAGIDEDDEREPFDPNKAFTNARLSAGALGVGRSSRTTKSQDRSSRLSQSAIPRSGSFIRLRPGSRFRPHSLGNFRSTAASVRSVSRAKASRSMISPSASARTPTTSRRRTSTISSARASLRMAPARRARTAISRSPKSPTRCGKP